MAWEGFACYSGMEIVNSARAAAYARAYGINVNCTGGPWMAESLGHAPYSSPDQDDAPWYDAFNPDSKQFLGVVGSAIDGAGGTGSSSWTDLLSDGARPGPIRRGAREVGFTATLVAADRAALAYGLGWLASALRGDLCNDAGEADQLVVYAAPPVPPAATPSEPCTTALYSRAAPVDFDAAARGDELERTLFRCRLLEGPEIASMTRIQGGVTAEVTWTIKAGVPYWYHRPTVLWALSNTDLDDHWTAVALNWDSQQIYADCERVEQDNSCLTPPPDANYDCPPLDTPIVPRPPKDPCYKGDFYPNAWRTLYRIPAGRTDSWLEKAPVFEIANGDRQMRSLMLRWHSNPAELPPHPDNLNPCGVCAELWIAYLPPYATLYVDSRRQVATVDCAGSRTAEPILFGQNGGVYTWPTLECSTGMYLEMVIDGRYGVSQGLDLTISLAERQDAC
ncbi:hypothetical protein [Prauserella sediminis]|uniref:hypothetical protein n=1 Tax=Prauserella sediminis TaxID=577680 RepID=UPI001C84BC3B|nr:hypothetical protein [Prauserella sediminis]